MIEASTLKVYSKSLLEVSIEEKQEMEVKNNFDLLLKHFDDNPEYFQYITSNFYSINSRINSIKEVYTKVFLPNFVRFINILIKTNLLVYLKKIYTYYKQMLDEKMGITFARVYSKYPLNNKMIIQIEDKLKLKYKYKSINIENVIDESIISGIRIKLDSFTIDATANAKLNKIRDNITKGVN